MVKERDGLLVMQLFFVSCLLLQLFASINCGLETKVDIVVNYILLSPINYCLLDISS